MALRTSNLQVHFDFSDTNCYPGTGTTAVNLGLAGSTYDGYINADSIRAGTSDGTAPTFSSDNGGIFNFGGNKSRITLPHGSITSLATTSEIKTIQAWVKFDSLTNNLNRPTNPVFGKLSANFGFDGYIGSTNTDGAIRLTLNDAAEAIPTSGNNEIVTDQWYFLTWAFSGANANNAVEIYKDDTNLTISPTTYGSGWSIAETNAFQIGAGLLNPTGSTYGQGALVPGSMECFIGSIGAFYLYDDRLTAQDVIDNYNATSGRFLGGILVEPATASSEFGTDPVISTTSNFNYEQTFIPVTALMTEPTIVTTSGDYVHIQTSITVSAEFIDPLSYGGTTNISNAADLMIASAEILEHVTITGSGIDYFADETTATAELVMPIQFGDPDIIILATPLLATNSTFENPSIFVTPNYFNLIKRLNPAVYINGGLTNYGYATPSTVQVQSSYSRAPEVEPMSYIYYDGSNNSYKYINAVNGNEEINITGTGVENAIASIHATRNWTYEFWFKPNTPEQKGWDDGDSNTNVLFSSSYLALSVGVIGTTLSNTQPNLPAKITINDTTELEFSFNIPFAQIPSYNWHHIAIVAEPFDVYNINNEFLRTDQRIKIFLNGNVLSNTTHNWGPDSPSGNKIAFNPVNGEIGGLCSFDELAFYGITLSDSEILDHYSFIQNYDPSNTFYAQPAQAEADFANPNIISVQNINFPEIPTTANAELINGTVIAQINISNSAIALTANANIVEPFFYGDPDVTIIADPATAYAEIPQNVYRLDTAYYSYVMQNIAPFRYVTFDSPNSDVDYGSDNDYGGAAPFVYNGTVTLPINGLNNNSLISDGLSYTTSGLIMKESEYNDSWGTDSEIWHTSFWIQKDVSDTNPNGLRVIANLNGYKDNQHIILYQYNNMFYLSMNDKNHAAQTFASAVNVNVFDGNKHHIVITSKGDNKIFVYKNKIEVLEADYGSIHVITTNSTTSVPPNAETDNRARFAIGALITPYAETNLPVFPTPSIMYIDDVHWAVTHINETSVINLFNAMPYKFEIDWLADPALSNFSELVDPTLGTGFGHNATPATSSAELINPTVYTEIEKIVSADILDASAESIEPFSVVADNITNINVVADFMLASALLLEHQGVIISIPGGPMLASANMISSKPYYDEYNLLIIQQTAMPLGASLFGKWSVGDIDS